MNNYQQAAILLRQHDNYVIISHDFPDADGLGAAYALHTLLDAMDKTVSICIPQSGIERYGFIDKRKIFRCTPQLMNPNTVIPIIVDTNERGNLDPYAECLLESATSYIVFDHHEIRAEQRSGKEVICSLIDTDCAATCEIIFRLSETLELQLAPDAADALFLGIVFDTGSFSYQKTSTNTFKTAAKLLEYGANPAEIAEMVTQNRTVQALQLRQQVFSTLELRHSNTIAIQTMTRAMLEQTGAFYEDAEDFINTPLECRTVELSVLFKENDQGVMRCSLRSKHHLNVAQVARKYGGGGHKRAAGFLCKKPYPVFREQILDELTTMLEM